MEDFRFLAGDAAANFDLLRPVRCVRDVIDVGVRGAAMRPHEVGVEAPTELEILRDALRLHYLVERPAPDHRTFANASDRAAHAVEIAPDVAGERTDLVVRRG